MAAKIEESRAVEAPFNVNVVVGLYCINMKMAVPMICVRGCLKLYCTYLCIHKADRGE